MRHRDPSPPPRRRSRPPLLRGLIRQSRGRLLLGAAVILTVTGLMLTIPVVSGRSERTSTVALESSSSSSSSATPPAADRVHASSPVVLGVDGAPARSGTPGPSSAASSATTEGGSPTGSSSSSSSSAPSSAAHLAGTKAPTTAGTSTSGSSTSSSSASSSSSSSSQTTSDAPAAPAPADPVGRLLGLVNAQRTAAGCGALAVDDALAAKAQAHSAAMRDQDYVGLTDPVDGSVLDQGARAATVARGSADPATVLAGWLADPQARSAILGCDLTTVGIGTAAGATGPWWTVLLA